MQLLKLLHAVYQCLYAFLVPYSAVMPEHPALHYPYCIGVRLFHGLIDRPAVCLKGLLPFLAAFRPERDVHFIEAVDKVVFSFTEFLFPLLYVFGADDRKKAVKRRKHVAFQP